MKKDNTAGEGQRDNRASSWRALWKDFGSYPEQAGYHYMVLSGRGLWARWLPLLKVCCDWCVEGVQDKEGSRKCQQEVIAKKSRKCQWFRKGGRNVDFRESWWLFGALCLPLRAHVCPHAFSAKEGSCLGGIEVRGLFRNRSTLGYIYLLFISYSTSLWPSFLTHKVEIITISLLYMRNPWTHSANGRFCESPKVKVQLRPSHLQMFQSHEQEMHFLGGLAELSFPSLMIRFLAQILLWSPIGRWRSWGNQGA